MALPLAPRLAALTRIRGAVGGSLLVTLTAAVVGFLLVGQLQGPERKIAPLEAESEGDLARILANLNSEADALQSEIAELKVQLNELRQSSRDDAAAAEAADQQLRSLQVLSGAVPVTGPGVVVVIEDPNGLLGYDAMIDIVQELRDAGAEAVAVNDRRVGVATAFAERDGRISVDGVLLSPPLRVTAIGQPATLEGGLKIPGGAVDAISAVKGVRVEVTKHAKVDLPALAKPPRLEVARPVPRQG
ncbi:MAG: DUF881 domain-containing protein [Actinobacteria bacterium]|nr:DUF881 domain-containing protein [Actinomycetota bacterium]